MDITVENVSHRYGDKLALSGVSFEVRDREILALLGPSGCGKSTLLAIIGGILAPSEGRVTVSRDIPADCLNPFTYIFQDFALLPWRTVRGNVGFVLEHHPLSAAERRARVDEALARIGLIDFADAWPAQLSGGMRQRVGIARAFVVAPALLLMDEPMSALDAQTRELVAEDFMRLWGERPTTAVLVTHNLQEACDLADRVVVLSRRPGRLREIVTIPVPRSERRTPAAAAEMMATQQRIWALIRDEAASAERELE